MGIAITVSGYILFEVTPGVIRSEDREKVLAEAMRLPGGLLFNSCMDETVAGSETARGCVAESSATPASVLTPTK